MPGTVLGGLSTTIKITCNLFVISSQLLPSSFLKSPRGTASPRMQGGWGSAHPGCSLAPTSPNWPRKQVPNQGKFLESPHCIQSPSHAQDSKASPLVIEPEWTVATWELKVKLELGWTWRCPWPFPLLLAGAVVG